MASRSCAGAIGRSLLCGGWPAGRKHAIELEERVAGGGDAHVPVMDGIERPAEHADAGGASGSAVGPVQITQQLANTM
jgi:hypothetical protein